MATEAAVHGHGVALGDSVTASALLARGMLVAPFSLSVPAVDEFYIVCRNEMRTTPIVQVFIDWLFAEKAQDDGRADAPVAGRIVSRRKRPALRVIGAKSGS
jgi:LysR family glycine cleavage system transcriptional activator